MFSPFPLDSPLSFVATLHLASWTILQHELISQHPWLSPGYSGSVIAGLEVLDFSLALEFEAHHARNDDVAGCCVHTGS